MRAVKGQRSKVKGLGTRVLRRLAMSGAWLRVKGSWFLLTAIMLMSLGLFSSCEYKELCYDHNHWAEIAVSFDWSKATTANCESMTVLFYNV